MKRLQAHRDCPKCGGYLGRATWVPVKWLPGRSSDDVGCDYGGACPVDEHLHLHCSCGYWIAAKCLDAPE